MPCSSRNLNSDHEVPSHQQLGGRGQGPSGAVALARPAFSCPGCRAWECARTRSRVPAWPRKPRAIWFTHSPIRATEQGQAAQRAPRRARAVPRSAQFRAQRRDRTRNRQGRPEEDGMSIIRTSPHPVVVRTIRFGNNSSDRRSKQRVGEVVGQVARSLGLSCARWARTQEYAQHLRRHLNRALGPAELRSLESGHPRRQYSASPRSPGK